MDSAPSEAAAATNVVHGEQILAMWQNNDPAFAALRAPANTADFTKIDAIFTRLADLVDALGDVLTANSVHQVARGNFNRAGLTLADAVLRGEPLPPAKEAITTSRTGTGLLHRVIEFLDTASIEPSTWPTNAMQSLSGRRPVPQRLGRRSVARPAHRHVYGHRRRTTPRTVALAELQFSRWTPSTPTNPNSRARCCPAPGH